MCIHAPAPKPSCKTSAAAPFANSVLRMVYSQIPLPLCPPSFAYILPHPRTERKQLSAFSTYGSKYNTPPQALKTFGALRPQSLWRLCIIWGSIAGSKLGKGSMYSTNWNILYRFSVLSLSRISAPSGGSILALSGTVTACDGFGLMQLRETCQGCCPTNRQFALCIMYFAIDTGFTLSARLYQSREEIHFRSVYRWW